VNLFSLVDFVVAILLLSVSFIRGISQIKPGFIYFLIVSIVLNSTAILLFLKSSKVTDISLAAPLLSFTPLFLIATSFLMLGEKASPYGIAGILFIVTGAYLLNFEKGNNPLKPIKEFFKHKGMIHMTIVSLIFSFSCKHRQACYFKVRPFFG
jgi:drug/metabolite transporter (DMT)-like permease